MRGGKARLAGPGRKGLSGNLFRVRYALLLGAPRPRASWGLGNPCCEQKGQTQEEDSLAQH